MSNDERLSTTYQEQTKEVIKRGGYPPLILVFKEGFHLLLIFNWGLYPKNALFLPFLTNFPEKKIPTTPGPPSLDTPLSNVYNMI
jgi:hypothetical protein